MKKWAMPVAFIALVAVLAGPALAGGNGGGGQSAVATIAFAGGSGFAATSPTYGSNVAFAVDALRVKDKDLFKVWVANKCWSGGQLVLTAYQPVTYSSYRVGTSGAFTLSSNAWGGGAGTCTAYVWIYPDFATAVAGGSMTYSVS